MEIREKKGGQLENPVVWKAGLEMSLKTDEGHEGDAEFR